jgi:hypothetical protein
LETRLDASDESAVNNAESFADRNDVAVFNAVDSDTTSDTRLDIRDETVVDRVASTSQREDTALDIVVDNDVTSEVLADAFFSIDALITITVEFIIVPVDIAEATFESLSKTDGAPPTNDITAAATAFDR